MKRGLPKDGSSARDVRIRRAASAARGKSVSGRSAAPWWHQPLLWLLLAGSALLVNSGAQTFSVPAYASVAFGALALWLSYRLALRVARPGAALLATITIWLATSLPVHLYVQPFGAKMPAMPVFRWANPQWLTFAFSNDRGAFVWTPVLALATLGILVAILRKPAFGIGLLAVAGASFYLAAAADAAQDVRSFGNGLLLVITPVFVCGLAALIDALAGSRGRMAWTAAVSAMALLILWNLGLMLQWGTGLIPSRGPVDFSRVAANQVTVVPRAAKEFVIRYINERKGA